MKIMLAAAVILFACTSVGRAAAAATPAPSAPTDALHAWIGLEHPDDLERWVNWHLAEEKRLIARLEAVKGQRTLRNTLTAYDDAQFHLAIAQNQTAVLFAVHPHKEIRDRAQALQQRVAAQMTALNLNQRVYQALIELDVSAADAATKHYKDRILLEYRLAGVDKDEVTRTRVSKLQDQIIETQLKFSRNFQDDVRKIPVHDATELEGLPQDYLARHPPDSSGVIMLTTEQPDMGPVMSYAKSATLRRQMRLAYGNLAYPANESVLKDLLRKRQELASTLGFAHWADLAAADMMIGSVPNMQQLLDAVDTASRERSFKEYALIETYAHGQDPTLGKLTGSDKDFWEERYKQDRYGFASQSVRPYFAYATVEQGILSTAAQLFHLEFRQAKDLALWDPAVHAYAVYDGGRRVGKIYLDMHPREGKDKWFSESTLIAGRRGAQIPEATLVCNFAGGLDGDPGLMQFDDVVIFFHEFGHMMHDVLGGGQRWAGQSGVSTETDFVEAPSQMLEEMFHDPRILQGFAKHYQSGEVLPLETINRMNQASYFGRGMRMQGQVMYSTYSLQLHDQDPAKVDLAGLWREDADRFIRYQSVEGLHPFASFTHLTNYASNYYTYVLDKVIAVDFFAQFDPLHILDGPTAMRYRREVLEPGSSKPASELVRDFLGREQNIENLEVWMDRENAPAQ